MCRTTRVRINTGVQLITVCDHRSPLGAPEGLSDTMVGLGMEILIMTIPPRIQLYGQVTQPRTRLGPRTSGKIAVSPSLAKRGYYGARRGNCGRTP